MMSEPAALVLSLAIAATLFYGCYLAAYKPWRKTAVRKVADEYPIGTRVADAVVVGHRWMDDRDCAVCILRRYTLEYEVNHAAMARYELELVADGKPR